MNLSDEEWKQKLTAEQYRILRQKGTEAPFTGEFLHNEDTGIYTCAACGTELFDSQSKYDSTTPGLMGWPSFSDILKTGAVKLAEDDSLGVQRTEVVCASCGGHLGHLFEDESASTGQHYCINSTAISFNPADKKPQA